MNPVPLRALYGLERLMPAAKKPSEKKSKAAPKKAAPKKPSLPDVADESLSARDFVMACYLAILGREADAGGLKHYTQAIDLHGRPRQHVIDVLSASEEAKAKK